MRGSAGKNEVSRAQEEAQMAAWKEKRRLQAGDWRAPFTNPAEKNVTSESATKRKDFNRSRSDLLNLRMGRVRKVSLTES